MSRIAVSVLMAGIALGAVTPAFAQTPDDVAALKAEIAALKAQLSAMEKRLDTVTTPAPAPAVAAQTAPVAAPAKPAAPPVEITMRGSPQISGSGFTFKPRGRILFDVGNVSAPEGIVSRNLGTNARIRRIRLGAEGKIPGNFGYKLDFEFSNSAVDIGDAFLSYDPVKNATLRFGNMFALNGMESVSSSNYITFLERVGFNEAFSNSRRLGAALAITPFGPDAKIEAGIFAAHAMDATLDNDGYMLISRGYYAKKAMGGQFHLGMSVQHRSFSSNNNGAPAAGTNQPSTGQLVRLRSRPNSTLTDLRFVDTGNFAAKSMSILGIEGAALFDGPYVNFEAQWSRVNSYRAGETATGLDGFGGTNSAVTPTADPTFFGGFIEAGWFLTGEIRGYRDGEWGRTKVLNPVNKGGSGAFQLAGRFDYLDLDDPRVRNGQTNNFTTGVSTLAGADARAARGGTQTTYTLGLNWYPVDYVRFMLNYTHASIEGGPFAAAADPMSTDPINERDYGVNVVGARMQVDF